jgi:diketogulonate reductase-like aldo/keto reductase
MGDQRNRGRPNGLHACFRKTEVLHFALPNQVPDRPRDVFDRSGYGPASDKKEMISLIPFSPLGRGFLTGKITEDTKFDSTDFRNVVPRFTPENRKANQALVDLIGKFAEQKKVTSAQIALAWLLAQKSWIVPIPGTRKLHRLEENIGAVAVELTSENLRELDTAASKIALQGARYPEELQKLVGR